MGDFLVGNEKNQGYVDDKPIFLTTAKSIGYLLLRLMQLLKNWVMKIVVRLSYTDAR
jgi:hypothetical protein